MTKYFLRGGDDSTHRLIGRTLGTKSSSDDVTDPDMLMTDVETDDGIWSLWDLQKSKWTVSRIADFIAENRSKGCAVCAYRQLDPLNGGPIRRWDPEKEVESNRRRQMGKWPQHKAAVARLDELKRRKLNRV